MSITGGFSSVVVVADVAVVLTSVSGCLISACFWWNFALGFEISKNLKWKLLTNLMLFLQTNSQVSYRSVTYKKYHAIVNHKSAKCSLKLSLPSIKKRFRDDKSNADSEDEIQNIFSRYSRHFFIYFLR